MDSVLRKNHETCSVRVVELSRSLPNRMLDTTEICESKTKRKMSGTVVGGRLATSLLQDAATVASGDELVWLGTGAGEADERSNAPLLCVVVGVARCCCSMLLARWCSDGRYVEDAVSLCFCFKNGVLA